MKAPSGWRLFYEYSESRQSLIGRAFSSEPTEHWLEEEDPFSPRPESWDSWHLSTGPIAFGDTESPVMFYNGSDQDARWRIGWIEFDSSYRTVTARCDHPVIRPEHLPDGYNDIAFSASAIPLASGRLELYYSVGDRKLYKAIIADRRYA